jgi:hypothetical protein
MQFSHLTPKRLGVNQFFRLKTLLKSASKTSLFSFTMLLALDFDTSILFILVVLVGIITFLAGTAYGIYLNDKISTKQNNRTLS